MELSITYEKVMKGGKRLYMVRYGDADVVGVVAKDEQDAQEKFIFMLIYELRGKTIDFNPEKL